MNIYNAKLAEYTTKLTCVAKYPLSYSVGGLKLEMQKKKMLHFQLIFSG